MMYKILLVQVDMGPEGQPQVGYLASCPALPGLWVDGDTVEETLINIQYAIGAYLSVRDDLMRGEEREVEIPDDVEIPD